MLSLSSRVIRMLMFVILTIAAARTGRLFAVWREAEFVFAV